MTPDQILATVLSLMSAAPASTAFPGLTAGGAAPEYPVTIEACPRPLPPQEVEGKTVICGRVNVPENHDKADGTRIDLAFAVMKARTESPVSDPVVYLHGGPGGGAVRDLAGIVAPLWDSYRDRRDVITFDQRAAGISSDMVTCFGTLGANLVDFVKPGAMDDAKQVEFVSTCMDEVKTKGHDLTTYNSVQNAKDVRAVMSALGYPEYNLYGVSYGTRLALEVMRSAPEGLRSVVLDSVDPANARVYDTNIIPVQEGIQSMIDQCAADDICNAAYPDLQATVLRVADKLQKVPIPAARGRDEINLKTMIDLFESRNSAGRIPNTTGYIPLILTEWDRGETTTWDKFSSGALSAQQGSDAMLRPYLATLSPEQAALARSLLDGALVQHSETATAGKAVQALADSLNNSAKGGEELAKRFDDAVTQSIIRTQSPEEMKRFVIAYAGLATQKPDRAILRALVIDHLPATDIDPTLALLDQMTDAEVAAVFANISTEARGYYEPMVGVLDLAIVSCQEDMPFNSLDGMKAVNAGLKFPFLSQSSYADLGAYDLCTNIAPALPMANFHDAVVSDIPTLVLYGSVDTQTSAADAKLAAASLTHVTALSVPEAGHGSLIFSKCAKDIGLAFIERPAEAPNSACLATLLPKWILPPG